jgi:hypothetical protein
MWHDGRRSTTRTMKKLAISGFASQVLLTSRPAGLEVLFSIIPQYKQRRICLQEFSKCYSRQLPCLPVFIIVYLAKQHHEAPRLGWHSWKSHGASWSLALYLGRFRKYGGTAHKYSYSASRGLNFKPLQRNYEILQKTEKWDSIIVYVYEMIIEFTRRFYVALWKSYEGLNFHRPLSIRLLCEYLWAVIVGLDVALKGPFSLVGESETACFSVFHLLEIYIIQ